MASPPRLSGRPNINNLTSQSMHPIKSGSDLSVQERTPVCSKLLTPVVEGKLPCEAGSVFPPARKASQSTGWVFIFAITTSLCLLKASRILNTNWSLARSSHRLARRLRPNTVTRCERPADSLCLKTDDQDLSRHRTLLPCEERMSFKMNRHNSAERVFDSTLST